MVRSRRHSAHSVVPGKEASGYGSREKTLSVTSIVDSLEEDELRRVQRFRGVEAVSHVLHRHVCVPDNLPSLQELRSGIICSCSVGERSCNKVVHLNGDAESGAGFDASISSFREGNDTGDHICLRRDITHG